MGQDTRTFSFEPTPAVAQSRQRTRYVDCSICQVDNSQYLFHKVGVRYVQCRSCGMVYVNPVGEVGENFLDVGATGALANEEDHRLFLADFDHFLRETAEAYQRVEGKPLERTLMLGRWLPGMRDGDAARRAGLQYPEIDYRTFRALVLENDIEWAKPYLSKGPQVVVLNELLEAVSDPGALMKALAAEAPDAWFVVTYTNSQSMPARLMRRYWPGLFWHKSAFFNTNNLTKLLSRFGLVLAAQFPYPTTRTASYVLERVAPEAKVTKIASHTPLKSTHTPLRTGHHVALFRKPRAAATQKEKLSIVFPVFNEARYVEQVIEGILSKQLKIEKELVIVESNSTDGTREIVKRFEGRPGVSLIFEEKPRGKGHAVRTGLKAVTGSIVLIQDADFEYDIDDYDALIEPILQRRTNFVLGSRTLGLDDWKVRRFAKNKVKGLVLNSAQILFAKTFNTLYQQEITDVNTMFKVFRRECLEGLDLESNGFELDIELACKLVKNGNAALEVPVNYVARGFEEGKKISFVRDSFPSYYAFFKYRFR